MSEPDIRPYTRDLIARMTPPASEAPAVEGDSVEFAKLDVLALGDLWTVAHRTDRSVDQCSGSTSVGAWTASTILKLGQEIEPAFRGEACRDYIDFLAEQEEAEPDRKYFADWPWRKVRFALSRCRDLSVSGLASAAQRFLAAADWTAMPPLVVALARLVDPAFEARALDKLAVDLAAWPLVLAETQAAAALDLAGLIVTTPERDDSETKIDDSLPRLAALPAYAAFAETGLRRAAAQVRKIHDGMLPYAADKAFVYDESPVIARLTRVALLRDAPWLPPLLDELFLKVSIAPGAAKTAPSQSVAIALGHAIEAFPTPEALASLHNVLRHIRHAGVKKKLQRNVRGAERGLANRPEIALRLPPDKPLTKAQVSMLTQSLEASLGVGVTRDLADWRTRLAAHPQAKSVAGALIWRLIAPNGESVAIMPSATGGKLALHDVAGAEVAAGDAHRVALWHPVDATEEERGAWRDRLVALRIKQPFKQAFREHYCVPTDAAGRTETALFADVIVAVQSFVGQGRREGWHLEYQAFARPLGRWVAKLALGFDLYHGAVGWTRVETLALFNAEGATLIPARFDDVPAAALSEMLRATDRLVGASAFALSALPEPMSHDIDPAARQMFLATQPLGATAAMRKEALRRVLAGQDGMEDLTFDELHLRLGPYAIHLATAAVTCDGAPVTLDLPPRPKMAAAAWRPYDETLIETILFSALEIARRSNAL